MKLKYIRLFGLSLLLTGTAIAQQTSIYGKVTDVSGAVVTAANVSAERADGGAGYATATNDSGVYQFPSIVASAYVLRVKAPGFAMVEKKVAILIGQSLTIDFAVVPAAASQTVEVSSTAETIDVTSSQVSGNVDPAQVNQLPLNGNNWQQLSVVVPGVRVNAIDNTPLSRNSTGTFQINLDGQQVTQSNEYAWKGEPQYSRDAIQEFEITTNRFDATHGRSSGILINAQSKSGSNSTHGSAFGYFRNDALNAADPVAKEVVPYSDQIYGGTIGGPIRKDKLYYFGSYEGERNPFTDVSNPVGFPEYQAATVITMKKVLARWDYKYDDNNTFSLRASGHQYRNPLYGASGTSNPSALEYWRDNSLSEELTYTHTFSPSVVSEFHFGVNHDYYGQDVLHSAPQLVFPNTTVGSDIFAPTKQNQEDESVREDFYWLKGKHNIKLGTELIHVLEHGIYSMEQNGQAVLSAYPGQKGTALANLTWAQVFPSDIDPSTWNLSLLNPVVSSYTQTFGDPHFKLPRETFGAWIQDDWKILPRLTLNLGLRYDNDFGLYNSHVPASEVATLNANGIYLPTHGDNHEVGPRIGLNWDPDGKGKTSIRGGAGIYYADQLATFTKRTGLLNGLTWVTPSITGSAASPVNLLNPFGATAAQIEANPLQYRQAITVMGPNVETPWSAQASIGVQREVSNGIVLSADYLHNRTKHLLQGYEKNVYPSATSDYNLNPATAGRPNPKYASITEYDTPAGVGDIYDALLVDVRNVRWGKLEGSVAYTLAREKDNVGENNPFNYEADWGPSVDNQTHTVNATLSYRYRWGLRSSVIFHYGSGTNYAVTAGNSPTGLGASTSYGLANRTYCGLDATYSGCASHVATYDNPVNNYYDPKSGLDIVERDSFVGKPIQRLDVNLAKDIALSDRFVATVQVEAFNALNHANYGAYTTSITNPLFGKPATSTDTAYWPRSLQFSARLRF